MDALLKIVGGLALLGGGIFAAFILLVLWKLRRSLQRAGKSFPTPSTVTLTEDPAADWTHQPGPERELAELAALGYARGPAFTLPEMPGVGVVALHHPATGAHGAYCHHPAAGEWADLCATFADGTELTVGNPPQGDEMDTRPGTRKILRPRLPLAELHALLVQELAGQSLQAHRPEDFRTAFQDAYAKDMAWRNAKGGTSAEEFQRIAARHEQPLTAEQLQLAFTETKRREIDRWSDEAIAAFAASTSLPVAEWQRYETVIHLRTPAAGHGYGHSNPLRIETPVESAEIDARIAAAWAGHPGLVTIPASDDFMAKANAALRVIARHVPPCCTTAVTDAG